MTDRDHFAAAALTVLLSRPQWMPDECVPEAYKLADAMLREREQAAQKMAESDSSRAVSTNHDAAPAARANAESVAPQPTAGDRSGNPTSHSGTGNQPAPPCVETDGLPPGSRTGQINRTPECESPRRELGEGSLRDVPQLDNSRAAGGPEHHISDRSQPVKDDVCDRSKPISDERLAALEELSALDQELELEHGITGNPMIKPQVNNHPEPYVKSDEKRILCDTKSPRNGALSGCETVPDPDSRVWETPCTPQTHATPTQGSVQGEGSFRVSQNANEPVAWGVEKQGYPPMFSLHTDWNWACRTAMEEYGTIVPLYRHPQPTLTDEEREAVEEMLHLIATRQTDYQREAHTLRKLLERLGGER